MQEYYAGNGNMNQGGDIKPMTRERLITWFEENEKDLKAKIDSLTNELEKYVNVVEPIYTCAIWPTRVSEGAFAVMRMHAPDFPDNQPHIPDISNPLTVIIAANDDGGKWGYVSLSPAEKAVIGDVMSIKEIPYGVWHYCELFEQVLDL